MELCQAMDNKLKETSNKLNSAWTMWAHLPHDTDWSISSYKKIMTFNTIEEILSLLEIIPEKMVKNCMLFIMRDETKPTWEDPINRNGGCFSYKIFNKNVISIWNLLCYALIGESMSNNIDFCNSISGLTISPKKNFCIIKIWMSNCNNQDHKSIIEMEGLNSHTCIFKKHAPEY
tara:strand:+ start:90 stop:614 length:525 start_codon:yes stop_codon:yes gene_type:complete